MKQGLPEITITDNEGNVYTNALVINSVLDRRGVWVLLFAHNNKLYSLTSGFIKEVQIAA